MPTMAALMAHIPPSRARNPSLLFQAAQPAPPIDADLSRARFQHNNGQFRNHVVANDAMTRGIAQTQLEDFLRGPGTKILLPVADGGRQFFQVDFETPVDDQIKLALRTLAPTSEINVRLPVPANQYTSGTAKYGGPRSILVDIADAAEAAAVVANKTFAVHEGLAFWAHDYLANAATRNWAFAHYSSWWMCQPPCPAISSGLVRTAYQNQAAFHKVDMATQPGAGPPPRSNGPYSRFTPRLRTHSPKTTCLSKPAKLSLTGMNSVSPSLGVPLPMTGFLGSYTNVVRCASSKKKKTGRVAASGFHKITALKPPICPHIFADPTKIIMRLHLDKQFNNSGTRGNFFCADNHDCWFRGGNIVGRINQGKTGSDKA
ncbi:hypothetical protein B0H14DRAFT_2641160 [Mycena olivaceomarginata]|nr:hypothetical protein B0H14DRAFT_2641160 [Mycena olivaceomarginata]